MMKKYKAEKFALVMAFALLGVANAGEKDNKGSMMLEKDPVPGGQAATYQGKKKVYQPMGQMQKDVKREYEDQGVAIKPSGPVPGGATSQ